MKVTNKRMMAVLLKVARRARWKTSHNNSAVLHSKFESLFHKCNVTGENFCHLFPSRKCSYTSEIMEYIYCGIPDKQQQIPCDSL